ncbi:MAG: SDR family oxidoreductase [Pseudomonadota bacterium]
MPARFADLARRSVVVTGGASGIGAAVAAGFLEQGANVAVLDIADGQELVGVLGSSEKKRLNIVECDVSDAGAVAGHLSDVANAQGAPQVLVNCAANDRRHGTEEVTEEFWDWSMSINLKSYFFTARAVLPAMRAAGHGAIINFSSVAYMMGMAGFPCYTTANAGIVSLTQSLAREFGPHGVRVNAVAPGMVLTPRQKELWLTPESVAGHVENQCLRHPLVPEDLVGPVLFLASGASQMITGQTMIVDGGLMARA